MKVLLLAFCASCALAGAGERERPLMRDFIVRNVDAAQSSQEKNMLRSYPENPTTKWMENLRQIQKWRIKHAPTKELWVAKFGYDVSVKLATPGDETTSITEEQQAMWTVRSFLLLAGLGVDRAHLIFTNDADEPQAGGAAPPSRASGCPLAPSQTRTCRFPASGSSGGRFATWLAVVLRDFGLVARATT